MENAKASRETEPGCRQFGVSTDPAAPNRVFLHEVCADRAAFDVHLASARFKALDGAVAQRIDAKVVRTYVRIGSA